MLRKNQEVFLPSEKFLVRKKQIMQYKFALERRKQMRKH